MKIVSVKIDHLSTCTFCNAKDFDVKVGNIYIIRTEFGDDIGKICKQVHEIKGTKKLKNKKLAELIRLANQEDFKKIKKLETKNQEALNIAKEKVKKHQLSMKIFTARYMFDEKRLMFYFSAENRIDFRNFVKDLASVFKMRIELRQVSQREEARMIGGLGICGLEQCCCTFLNKLDAVSIKMAKDQNLSLNAVKISGNCGKLLCCLAYEYETYKEIKKAFPKENSMVKIDVKGLNKEKYIGYNIPSSGEMTCLVKGCNIIKKSVYLEIDDGHIIEVKLENIKKGGVKIGTK
ncbi:MAG: stage 0 sporulation protein [Spirochaetes bacterium]|nr:stage 0 sporulation protein [Spirochaetota bacterium]